MSPSSARTHNMRCPSGPCAVNTRRRPSGDRASPPAGEAVENVTCSGGRIELRYRGASAAGRGRNMVIARAIVATANTPAAIHATDSDRGACAVEPRLSLSAPTERPSSAKAKSLAD